MISISPGHYGPRTGASGYIDEGTEAIKVAKRVTEILRASKVTTNYIQDTISKGQNANINWLVAQHNKTDRKIDVSIHFNSSAGTQTNGIGTEVLVYSTKNNALAAKLSKSISDVSGLKNRGAKVRTNLGLLKNTNRPCYLIEICFVNSKSDVDAYRSKFEAICQAIAKALAEAVGKKLSNPPQSTVDSSKENDEMAQQLPQTQKNDMKNLLTKAYNTRDDKGNRIFSVDHSSKVDKMTRGQATDLLISYVARTSK